MSVERIWVNFVDVTDFKAQFSKCLSLDTNRLHFAANSHHLWPNCTLDAQRQYWDDSSKLLDQKWEYLFSEIFPQAQRGIAELIGTRNANRIVFAPSTHEFVCRLLSCLDFRKKQTIVTTDSEFHSFNRQVDRLKESYKRNLNLVKVPTVPFQTFHSRFQAAVKKNKPHFMYLSHTFYDSAFSQIDGTQKNFLQNIIKIAPKKCLIALDAYHSFMAIPHNISAVENRLFYLAGGYKYAMAGEGMCFMHVPKWADHLRPQNTGWFAGFADLHNKQAKTISYADTGMRFAGSTFDPSGIYRWLSVVDSLLHKDLTVEFVHDHVQHLKTVFLDQLNHTKISEIDVEHLYSVSHKGRLFSGNFLAFKHEMAYEIHQKLKSLNIITDCRADILRFGFGIYQSEDDVFRLFERV